MPISQDILSLISTAGTRESASSQAVGIITPKTELVSSTLKHELCLYNGHLPYDVEAPYKEKIAQLKATIEEFKSRDAGEDGEMRELARKRIAAGIKQLISDLRESVRTTPKTEVTPWDPYSVQFVAPPHIIQMDFPGIEKEEIDSETGKPKLKTDIRDFEARLSLTIPSNLVIFSKKYPETKLQSGYDADFVIGIVTCEVDEDFSEIRIKESTLERADEDDIEVFDAIHELMRLYQEFGLGIITLRGDEELGTVGVGTEVIKEDYNLAESMKKYCEEKSPRSLLIRLISESKHLTKNNIGEILERIPFSALAGMGIDDICLDVMSCNTIERTEILTEALSKIARELDIKISANFYDGYIQNNNSFCYISHSEHARLISMLDPKDSAAVRDSIDLTWQQQRDFLRDKPTSKGRLIQVILPGFSNVSANDMAHLTSYVVSKTVHPILLDPREPQPSPVSPDDDSDTPPPSSPRRTFSFITHDVNKKLMRPHRADEIPQGRAWQWTVDCRAITEEVEAEQSADTAVDNSPNADPISPHGSPTTTSTQTQSHLG